MNYEKAYKEALEKARQFSERPLQEDSSSIVEYIFPELKEESEDERIRKAILTGLIDCRDAPDLGWSDFGGIVIDECIAWLEKQGEKKPIEVKEVDLEKEFDNYTKDIMACDVQFEPFTQLYNCAKHFFELGLKTQKGE